MTNQASPWLPVVRELDEWARNGIIATFWMRDDDAIRMTPHLDRLSEIAKKFNTEVGLAVIPARLTDSLSNYLNSRNTVFYPMCHGWRHLNYASPWRPGEFGPERPIDLLVDDARCAIKEFTRRFAGHPAVFVPPFARISSALIHELPKLGFKGVSTGPTPIERRYARLCSHVGIVRPFRHKVRARDWHYDVHIDPYDWGRVSARSPSSLAREIVGYLRARRRGFVQFSSPIGILMHHLQFDEETWAVCTDLLEILAAHPAVSMPPVRKILEKAPPFASSSCLGPIALTGLNRVAADL